MSNIYSYGWMGQMLCIVANSIEDAYAKLTPYDIEIYEIKDYEKYITYVRIIPISNDGKFEVYDIWEHNNE